MIPTGRAALLVASTAAAIVIFGPRTGIWLLAAATVATVLDALRLRGSAAGVRRVDDVVARGYAVPLEVRVTAPRLRVTRLRQPVPASVILERDEVPDNHLVTTVTATRRGRHELPEAVVRLTGPLGLAYRDFRIAGEHSLVVYPDYITANRIAGEVARGRFAPEMAKRLGPIGLGTEFDSIRDYQPGDELRRVNWPATLRSGRPMTNEYRLDQDRDVLCIVDAGRLLKAPLGGMTRLDSAIDAATAVAYSADAVGDRVGALAFTSEILRQTVPRRSGGRAVVEAIYDLQPTEVESDYEQAFRVAGRMKRALVMLFTDLFEPSAARPLLDAMPVLTRRHQVIVVSTDDEDLQRAVRGAESVAGAYRAVTALSAIEAKDLVVSRLRHAAATVVQAPAARLPAACVAAYLRAKSLARI